MSAAAVHAPRAPRIIPFARMGDESLAGRAAAGSADAFSALYERYYGPLLGYTRSILLNAEDAHDATQNALENALRALPRREPDRPLKPWLYRIAHNEAINIVRRRQPIAAGVETDDLLTVPGPEFDSEQRARLTQLVDDLRVLPERQRGALVMRELSGLSYGEIATALNVTPEGARRAVFDARTALHDAVDGRATECTSVRRCLSDGDRRRLRARGMRAHLRACDSCATFERAMGVRQTDLHILGPWLGGGTAVLGLLGYGTGTAKAGALAASSGAVALGGGGLSWTGLPVAIKGMAVAALVATTGTAAVELPKVVSHDAPARSAIGTAAGASSAAAISPLHDQVREQALAQAAAAGRTRRARGAREAAAVRARTSAPSDAARLTRDRANAQARALTPVPAAAPTTPPPTAVTATQAPAASPKDAAAGELQRVRDQILAAFKDAQALARPGTQGALAAANALIQTTLGSLGPLVDEVLASLGLKLPTGTSTTPPPSSVPSNTTVTSILAPVQSLLHGVDGLLKGLFGTR